MKKISFFFSLKKKILNAKIRRLEHLLHLKDVRIQDLTEKAEGTTNRAPKQQIAVKK